MIRDLSLIYSCAFDNLLFLKKKEQREREREREYSMIRKQLNHLLQVERREDDPMGIHIFK